MWSYNSYYDSSMSHGLFKYIDKYKSKAGNWVYVYKEKAKNAVNNFASSISKNFSKAQNKTVNFLNKSYDKINKTYSKISKNNPYMMNKFNYNKKKELVQKTKEWQDIVKSKNPEYVKKDKDGNTVYDIDNYIMKKKHVVLDILDYVANGREITTNAITPESIIAGADDYVQAGVCYVALRAKILAEAFKYRQGSYNDKEEEIEKLVSNGYKMANQLVEEYDKSVNNSDRSYEQNVVSYANTIKTLADNRGISVNDILNNQNVQQYLRDNGINENDLLKYL